MTDYAEVLSGTNDDVNAYIEANPDERDAVLAAEADGQNRKGIVEGPHATQAGADAQGDPSTADTSTKGATFAEAAAAYTEQSALGYFGSSPERERTGAADKGLSQQSPGILDGSSPAPDPRPQVDDSEAIERLKG